MLSPGTEQLLQIFIGIAALLLIPVAVSLVVVLFKLAFLMHAVQELVRMVSYELVPLLKDVRSLANKLEVIGRSASNSVQGLGSTLQQIGPLLKEGIARLRTSISASVSGLGRSFD